MAKQKAPEAAFDQALLSWQAPSYLRYERNWIWFLSVFGISAALVTYALFTNSWTMAAAFILLPLVLTLEHRKKPELQTVTVSSFGIAFGDLKIPYSNVKQFWILHNPPLVDELHLLTSSNVHPEVTIQLMGIDAALLRQYLVTQVLEREGQNLSMFDTLIRILRLA